MSMVGEAFPWYLDATVLNGAGGITPSRDRLIWDLREPLLRDEALLYCCVLPHRPAQPHGVRWAGEPYAQAGRQIPAHTREMPMKTPGRALRSRLALAAALGLAVAGLSAGPASVPRMVDHVPRRGAGGSREMSPSTSATRAGTTYQNGPATSRSRPLAAMSGVATEESELPGQTVPGARP